MFAEAASRDARWDAVAKARERAAEKCARPW